MGRAGRVRTGLFGGGLARFRGCVWIGSSLWCLGLMSFPGITRLAWFDRSIGLNRFIWIGLRRHWFAWIGLWCRSCRLLRRRWARCRHRIHLPLRRCLRGGRFLTRWRHPRRRDDPRCRCHPRWGDVVGGQPWRGRRWCWNHLGRRVNRRRRGVGYRLSRRADRCVGGIGIGSRTRVGHRVRPGRDVGAGRNAGTRWRGSCAKTDLPVHRAEVVLLPHDQGGQYADNDHGDRQKDHQRFNRTRPAEVHLMPPDRPP
jgi:hypothetical protein